MALQESKNHFLILKPKIKKQQNVTIIQKCFSFFEIATLYVHTYNTIRTYLIRAEIDSSFIKFSKLKF